MIATDWRRGTLQVSSIVQCTHTWLLNLEGEGIRLDKFPARSSWTRRLRRVIYCVASLGRQGGIWTAEPV
jgi:hypothetical protein